MLGTEERTTDDADVRKRRNPNDEEREPTNHANRREKNFRKENLQTLSHFSCVSWADCVLRVDRCAEVAALMNTNRFTVRKE